MVAQNLVQLTQQVTEEYANQRSFVVPTKQISLTKTGLLSTGKNEFILSVEGSEQFARRFKIRDLFFRLPLDLRAAVFNHFFHAAVAEGSIGSDIRINLNKEQQVIGFDDPKLLQIKPVKLMQIVNSSLLDSLSAEQIEVSRLHLTPAILSFSCYSPEKETEPRVDDIVNGGIDVHHSASGEFGTQIRCYLRRLACSNGACTHICEDEKRVRARRLHDGRFDEKDMLEQIRRLLTQAWLQIDAKLEAIKGLLNKERVSPEFLRQQRTRFSLSNGVLHSIEVAMNNDELGLTETAYDLFNAISQVATHDNSLSLRQQRRMMFMAGEFSQQTVTRCPRCRSWVIETR